MSMLILLRHGQSIYNKKNLFTGWTDVDLSGQGKMEAKQAAQLLLKHSFYPSICYTSWLKRSIHTAQILLETMDWEHIDCIKSWKLNERHYGAWQKRDKDEVKKEVGTKEFIAIRRGYHTPPPPLLDGDARLPNHDPKYAKLNPKLLPGTESLEDTHLRTVNFFYEGIAPKLAKGETVLVSAHGNSLRSLVMEIEKLTPKEITKVEIPTAQPILYNFDEILKMENKLILKTK